MTIQEQYIQYHTTNEPVIVQAMAAAPIHTCFSNNVLLIHKILGTHIECHKIPPTLPQNGLGEKTRGDIHRVFY